MSSIQEHYEKLLAKHYSWMFGDYDAKVQENLGFFRKHEATPRLSKRAIDLGCGSGFQSIALANLGFKVLSIDISPTLLAELEGHRESRDIRTVCADMLDFHEYCSQSKAEVVVCMGDTLTHLRSFDEVLFLFRKVYEHMESDGLFFLSFRDLTIEPRGVDRIIPVRSDESTIMTAFLEYENEHVNVHDVIYTKQNNGWHLNKSCYKKLRIGAEWAKRQLESIGFKLVSDETGNGLITIIASKPA